MAEHDSSYKLLFSHPEMVEDLLKGFVHEEWVEHVDFSTLEKVSGSYVSDDLRARHDDVIWKVRWENTWLYIYILLEFQSTVDPFMAVRIMVYAGLLYQDLVRRNELTPSGKLPPIFSVVVYNGSRRWDAPLDVADLIEAVPGGLDRHRPRLRYVLLDEGTYSEADLGPLQNLTAALFRLENSRDPESLRRAVGALAQWLREPAQTGLRRAFTEWLRRVLLPGRLPGVEIPQVRDLQEVETMLAERVKEWTEQWKREGLQEGRIDLLKQLLEHRFGPLPAACETRIESADAETLLEWGKRVLTAESLEDVFAD